MDENTQQKVALFRYALIAPILNETYSRLQQRNTWQRFATKPMMFLTTKRNFLWHTKNMAPSIP